MSDLQRPHGTPVFPITSSHAALCHTSRTSLSPCKRDDRRFVQSCPARTYARRPVCSKEGGKDATQGTHAPKPSVDPTVPAACYATNEVPFKPGVSRGKSNLSMEAVATVGVPLPVKQDLTSFYLVPLLDITVPNPRTSDGCPDAPRSRPGHVVERTERRKGQKHHDKHHVYAYLYCSPSSTSMSSPQAVTTGRQRWARDPRTNTVHLSEVKFRSVRRTSYSSRRIR